MPVVAFYFNSGFTKAFVLSGTSTTPDGAAVHGDINLSSPFLRRGAIRISKTEIFN
jgi:hypothetical protein